MQRISLQDNWLFSEGTITMMEMFMGSGDKISTVHLPHDAMIHRMRTSDTKNAHQTGFYPGGEYTYIRKWEVPKDWEYTNEMLEFEGIADVSRIYLNGELLTTNYNPYKDIWLDISGKLLIGQENELKVEVLSVEQSSRWYSGAGLYRPVYLWAAKDEYIMNHKVRLSTLHADDETATVEVTIPIKNSSAKSRTYTAMIEWMDAAGNIVSSEKQRITIAGNKKANARVRAEIREPRLWSDRSPYLYACRVSLLQGDNETVLDQVTEKFGIRTLQLSAGKGLCVNGSETKLRGTCIHHDNGIIGAATFADAEWKRCKELKEAGFNAIRSSHHPVSKYMLEACDALGMYVMDEVSDMWTRTKNPNDYANHFLHQWEADVEAMIDKDYNHPSVIIYSTGNEIPEAGTAYGAEWNRRIDQKIMNINMENVWLLQV